MDSTELAHLVFRWLHVLAGVMWIGQGWSLALAFRLTPGPVVDPALAPAALRAHNWLRWAATVTWITGIPLLGIVYYSGGAVIPGQSLGLATAVGLASLFVAWILYDAIWMLLARHQAAAALVSIVFLTAAAAMLSRVMTSRSVFIHLGAMLATIMLANVWQRIWPVESRRLKGTHTREQPSSDDRAVYVAAMRMRHNAALAVAVLLFMVSNHFPLVYGHSYGWLVAPGIVALGWIVARLCGVRSMAPTMRAA